MSPREFSHSRRSSPVQAPPQTSQLAASRAAGAIAALCAAVGLGVSVAHGAAPPNDDLINLGRSAGSGAVCQAIRDYKDPLAQTPAARAWSIRCLGWDVEIGRLYRLPATPNDRSWRSALTAGLDCQPLKALSLKGFTVGARQTCRRMDIDAPYVLLDAQRGRFTLAASGFADIADVLDTGLRVASGLAPPPAATELHASQAASEIAADFRGETSGMASAERAAKEDAEALLARGYLLSSEWRFDAAEIDFRSLYEAAKARNAPASQQAQALLNFALNISNRGRFEEADDLFRQADQLAASAPNLDLKGKALNYHAYHLRNQRRFEAAIQAAEAAVQFRAGRGAIQETDAAIAPTAPSDRIDAPLAGSLNFRPGQSQMMSGLDVPPEMRLSIQDAEALEIVGSSLISLNRSAEARPKLDAARLILVQARAVGVEVATLATRVESDLGDAELQSGAWDLAINRYQSALAEVRTRHAGSPPEAALLLSLGRAQIGAGRTGEAVETYEHALRIFRSARGSLGASAEAAAPYLDLLMTQMLRDPDHADAAASRFFEASESLVSDATAATIARLAARVASGDAKTASLVRAVDDTRRELNATESRIADQQAHNLNNPEARAAADADLKRLSAQLQTLNAALFNANPRYDQLVNATPTLSDVRSVLRPGEAYLKIILLGAQGYGLLITPQTAFAYPIALGRDEASDTATHLRTPFEDVEDGLHSFDTAGAYRLYQTLLGPIDARLKSVQHLIYEPDTALMSLPVSLLVTDQASVELMRARRADKATKLDYRGVAWLGARLDSSLVVSAGGFLQSRKLAPSQAGQLFLGFGDPALARSEPNAYKALLSVGANELDRSMNKGRAQSICASTRRALLRLDSLPDTRQELRQVANSLGAPDRNVIVGSAFTDAAVRDRKDLSDFKILYFATHALLPMPEACLSEPALATSIGADGSDGALNAKDIVNLKLDADLVVLSACDTGGAGASAASESDGALGGLARAMIYAGARNLIVSHWSVDSAATEQLMTDLFRSGAATASGGLLKAQLRMQADARLSHPYFWAPFTVVGDGYRPIPVLQAAAATERASR